MVAVTSWRSDSQPPLCAWCHVLSGRTRSRAGLPCPSTPDRPPHGLSLPTHWLTKGFSMFITTCMSICSTGSLFRAYSFLHTQTHSEKGGERRGGGSARQGVRASHSLERRDAHVRLPCDARYFLFERLCLQREHEWSVACPVCVWCGRRRVPRAGRSAAWRHAASCTRQSPSLRPPARYASLPCALHRQGEGVGRESGPWGVSGGLSGDAPSRAALMSRAASCSAPLSAAMSPPLRAISPSLHTRGVRNTGCAVARVCALRLALRREKKGKKL